MMLADWLLMGSTGSVAIASSTQGENTSKTQTTLAIAKPTCILNDVLISLALSDNNGTWTTHTGLPNCSIASTLKYRGGLWTRPKRPRTTIPQALIMRGRLELSSASVAGRTIPSDL